MRTFSCFTFEESQSTPDLTFIVTYSLERARELVRRELLPRGASAVVEICDGATLLCVETSVEA